jgi:cell division protein FtsL
MSKKRLGRWIFLAALIMLVSFVVASNVNLYYVYRKSRRLHRRIAELNRSIDSLGREIERLRSDTTYIEKIARERLGMARKDEKVYKFIEENK